MNKSIICEILGIKYPIFQGGMAWIADGKLAASVSEAGGLGIIAAGNANGEFVREQIKIARSLTNKPIGVNIMLLSPHIEEVAKVVVEEHVEVVTTGAGNPSKFMQSWKDANIKVIPVVASVAMAKLMTRLCATAVIAEGGESGGHVGELTTADTYSHLNFDSKLESANVISKSLSSGNIQEELDDEIERLEQLLEEKKKQRKKTDMEM